jgi:hypothetical protein
MLHVRRRGDYQLFDQLAKHFEDVWATAVPTGAGADLEPPSPPERQDPAAPKADPFLDQLDYVWRPDTS